MRELWNRFTSNPTIESWLVDKPIEIGLTLISALLLHWILRKLITRAAELNIRNHLAKLPIGRKEEPDVLAATREMRRQARVRTLAVVARNAVSVFIWSWASLSILGKLGVNVAPLIASAGVVGVTLGFGAQSLVKDFLSGIFMLIEDQYGVGDTIDIGEAVGVVEDVSLRLTTVRDINGTLWFVRNGEILRVGNFSQDYAVAIINTPVSLTANTQDAIEVVTTATKRACEEISDVLLDEPTIDGINTVAVDHMMIRTRIKTLPNKQWMVQRHIAAALVAALAKAGIPTPRVTNPPLEP